MTTEPYVDRDDELGLFESMVGGYTRERILLIRAESGLGKSVLLRAFEERCPPEVLFVIVDFKGGGVTLAELLTRSCGALGWEHFPNLSARVNEFVRGGVNIQDNTTFGRTNIDIQLALAGPDEDTREWRRALLTEAFVADLRALGRVSLVFDTYNDCDPVVKRWFTSAFLARMIHCPHLTVVIAGQSVPEQATDWTSCCHEHTLREIACKYWYGFVADVQDAWVDAYYAIFAGHPIKMRQALMQASAVQRT